MALDPGGEEAAKALARHRDSLKQYPHNKTAKEQLRRVFYEYDEKTEDSFEEVVVRALELLSQVAQATDKFDSSSGGGKSSAGRGKKKRPRESEVPINALSQPYRFIELPDQLAKPEDSWAGVSLNEPHPNGFTAKITVDWIAETPMLIGSASSGGNAPVQPLKIGDHYVLPGATLRGLVRSVAEIASYAKMTQGNWHNRFGIRDFYHPYFTEESGVSKVSEVKAGFLKLRPPSADEKKRPDIDQFVVGAGNEVLVYELQTGLDWGHVRIPSLIGAGVDANWLKQSPDRNGVLVFKDWVSLPLVDDEKSTGKYRLLGMSEKNKKVIDFTRRRKFRLIEERHGKNIYDVDEKDGKPGVVVVSGSLPGGGNKKFEYFVTPDDSAPRRLIPASIAVLFERLYSRPGKGDKLEPDGNWSVLRPLALSASGIPVFYIGDPTLTGSNFFFGLTRLFKVPHKYSVGEMLFGRQAAHKPLFVHDTNGNASYDNLDFAENPFGYVMEPGDWLAGNDDRSKSPGDFARKGRVAFGFAPLNPATPAELAPPVKVMQMAPRASFSPFYLKGKVKDYSSGDARIAGRKAYFPRYKKPEGNKALADFKAFGATQEQDVRDSSSSGKPPSPDVFSILMFLIPQGEMPLMFSGDIQMHNVSAAEIGLVLYAITHGGDREKRFRHLIGRGKPFGAGQFRVGRVNLTVEPNSRLGAALVKDPLAEEIYSPGTGAGFATEGRGQSLAPFIEEFEKHMRGQVGQAFPLNSAVIRDWLGMSDPAEGARLAAEGKLGYRPYARVVAGRDGKPKKFTAFNAYRELRESTQLMFTDDPPLGATRLLAPPPASPPKKS